MDKRPEGPSIRSLNDGGRDSPGECGKREPQMVAVERKPRPALLKPWFQRVTMRPMFTYEVGHSETAVDRNCVTDERPARGDRGHRRQESDLLHDRLGTSAAATVARRIHRSAP
jgi:hypothetical protein